MPSISEQKHLHIKVGSAAITITFLVGLFSPSFAQQKKKEK
jgi:hypothetical protein